MRILSFLLLALVASPGFSKETAEDLVQRELVDAVERISRAKAELIRLESKEDAAAGKLKAAERRLAAAYGKAEASYVAEHERAAAAGQRSTDLPLDRASCPTRRPGDGKAPPVRVRSAQVKTSWRKALVGAQVEIENAGRTKEEIEIRQCVTERGRVRLAFPVKRKTLLAGASATLRNGAAWADPVASEKDDARYELVTDLVVRGCRVDRFACPFAFRERWLCHDVPFVNGRRAAAADAAADDSLAPVRRMPAPVRGTGMTNDPNAVRRDAYRRQAAELEAKGNAIKDRIRQSLKSVEAMTLRAEMLEGVRKFAPRVRERLSELHAYEEGEAKVVAGPGPCLRRELMLESGCRYRVTAQVKADGVKGTAVVLRLHAPFADGSALQASADIGAGTFDWRPVAFDFEAPSGVGLSSLEYGLEGGTGTASFRDVTVYSVARTLE